MSDALSGLVNTFGGGVPRGAAQAGQTLGGGMAGLNQAFQPYVQAGQGALGQYGQALSPMLNPQAFYQQMMQGYTQSPQAKLAEQQGLRTANAAAAASGMLGSGAEQKALQQFGQQLTAADQQNYLNNMENIYGQGLQGFGNIAGMGLQGAGTQYGINADLLKAQAMAQMAGQMGQAQGKSGAASSLGNLFGRGSASNLLGDVGSGVATLLGVPGHFGG